MLEATSSTSLPLSLFLLATKMVAIHTSSVREPDVASFAASLSCKRHKLIMSRKKRHSLRQLSLSLTLPLSHSHLPLTWTDAVLLLLCLREGVTIVWSGLVCSAVLVCPGRTHWILCQGGIISQSCKVKCLIKSLPSERMRKNSNFSLNVAHSKLCVELGTGFWGIVLVVSRTWLAWLQFY